MTDGATGSAPTVAGPRVAGVSVSGDPTPEEAAAIVAAVELLWPRPAPPQEQGENPSNWRFSRRWWSRPVPARRDRPF